MEYKCFRCGYESSYKRDVKKHLLRKKQCDVKILNITREKYYKNYGRTDYKNEK
jgi:DNA-directed RNA polymerase subunit RPC12/RpoP